MNSEYKYKVRGANDQITQFHPIVVKGGNNFLFFPLHESGKSGAATAICKAIVAARADGVEVNDGVGKKFAPTGYAWNDGGPAFQVWLKKNGLELCKSDKSGAYWTVVKISDVTRRDRAGVAINANNKFSFLVTK